MWSLPKPRRLCDGRSMSLGTTYVDGDHRDPLFHQGLLAAVQLDPAPTLATLVGAGFHLSSWSSTSKTIVAPCHPVQYAFDPVFRQRLQGRKLLLDADSGSGCDPESRVWLGRRLKRCLERLNMLKHSLMEGGGQGPKLVSIIGPRCTS